MSGTWTRAATVGLVALAIVLALPPCAARDLRFEERVRAQAAIERVYWTHQIGAAEPFEEAVPEAVLEHKVRLYLRQSAALETLWGTQVTAEALRREVERMVRGTRMPGRLYDPPGHTWSPTSTNGAPIARSGHTAVWTGSSMIVWGGEGLYPAILTGGRYALGHAVDDDGDGLSECDGDCNDVEPGAFAVPAEVDGLIFAGDAETLAWQSAVPGSGSSTVHDVIRGTLDDPVAGSGEMCLAPGTPAARETDPATPAIGEGFWYLVRGRNACGPGPYGAQSDGTPATSTACP